MLISLGGRYSSGRKLLDRGNPANRSLLSTATREYYEEGDGQRQQPGSASWRPQPPLRLIRAKTCGVAPPAQSTCYHRAIVLLCHGTIPRTQRSRQEGSWREFSYSDGSR